MFMRHSRIQNYLRLFALTCSAGVLWHAPSVQAANVLLVINNSSPSYQESLRISQFQSWGHTVNTIQDSSAQSAFDAAFANNDVVYVSEEVSGSDVSYKVREATIGVVNEERRIDSEMGFSTSDGGSTTTSNVYITDNSHDITNSFSTGNLYIGSNLPAVYLSGTTASGAQVLGRISGNDALVVLEAGAALANNYNGNNTASGRRVQLPFGDGSFDFSDLSSNGLTIVEKALLWAAGGSSTPEMIGNWRLDESSGTTAADSSTYGQNGTVSGGTNWTTRCSGVGAFDFNGSSNYISIPNASQLQPTSALTIAAWIYGDSWDSGSNVNVILRKGEGNPNNYQLAIADGQVALYLDDNDDQGIRGNSVLATGQWYHVAATWDGSTVKIYVNGQLDNTPTSYTGNIGTDTRPVYIGGRSGTDYFDGLIQDVRFYNYAFGDTEIDSLAGLVGHWEFSEGTGTTAADSSSLGNDATLSGGATWTTDCGGTSALLTDGAGGIAQTASPFTPPDAGTVAFWMQSSGAPAGTARIFGVGGDWEARQSSDGTISFDLCGDATPDFITTVPLDEVGQWYHVAATFNSADDSYAIYINGELDKSGTNSNAMSQQAADVLSFGTRTGSTQYWQGALRDFRVYNRILCPDEIAALSESFGLVGEWKLDETSGTVAVDSSPTGRNGTYRNGVSLAASSPVQVDGAVAAVFDGNNDYVSIADDSVYDITGPITVAAWIKVSSFTKTWQAIFTKGDSAWRLSRSGNTNTIHFACTGLSNFQVNGSVDVNDSQWHQIVGVYDGSSLLLYVDGELDASVSSSGSISTNNYDVEIARNGQASGREFHGAIYDARVYDRALCPDEVQQLYGDSGSGGRRIIQWLEVQ